MSKIRLFGDSSGYMEIAPPAAGSSATVTLPNSAGEILLSDGSAASLTQIPAANLVGVCTAGLTRTGGFGKFSSYAVLCDAKSGNSDGGTFNNGDWRTRDLNTEVSDADSIVSLSSNQFTLQAGSYLINAFAPACQVSCHQTRIYNVTDTTVVQLGSVEFAYSASASGNPSYVSARVTITAAKVFEIQHRCANSRADYGFGVGTSGGYNWNQGTKFTFCEIYKEA